MYRTNSLMIDPPFLLLQQGGNQCGLVTTKHSPCIMERGSEPVEWSVCPLVRDARMEGSRD